MSWNVLAGPSQTLLAAAILQTEDECRTCSNGDLLTLNTLFMISNYELWCFLARLTPHWKLHCKYLRKKIIAALWRVCPCKTVFFVGSSRPPCQAPACVLWYVRSASELRNRIFMCRIFGLAWPRGSGDGRPGHDDLWWAAGSLHWHQSLERTPGLPAWQIHTPASLFTSH